MASFLLSVHFITYERSVGGPELRKKPRAIHKMRSISHTLQPLAGYVGNSEAICS
jgi:hypothetical protein